MDAQKIKLERLQLGLSQPKMAERLGVCVRTIQHYEAGKTPIPSTVVLLHNALKRNALLSREMELIHEKRKNK